MRICVPTETNEGLKSKLHGHFGSAPYFTVYDTEKNETSIIENTNAHHSHGTCHPLGSLGTADIGAVICIGMGARAVQKLNEAKIKAFKAETGKTIVEIIKDFQDDKLVEITLENACAQHSCH